jgi:uncharacterized membrane protein YqaE (UPF0057 family)
MLYVWAILLPPLAVYLSDRRLLPILLNIGLTCLGWIPGIVHAMYLVSLAEGRASMLRQQEEAFSSLDSSDVGSLTTEESTAETQSAPCALLQQEAPVSSPYSSDVISPATPESTTETQSTSSATSPPFPPSGALSEAVDTSGVGQHPPEGPTDGRSAPAVVHEGNKGAAERVVALKRMNASYEGGHPDHPKKKNGKLVLWSDRVEFEAGRISFHISLDELTGCELKPYQLGFGRSLSLSDDRSYQTLNSMIHFPCIVGGYSQEPRFHIFQGMTLHGHAASAADFRDALLALRPPFTRSSAPAAPSPPTATDIDLATRLRELASLRDDGILTDEEFEAKKVDILARM